MMINKKFFKSIFLFEGAFWKSAKDSGNDLSNSNGCFTLSIILSLALWFPHFAVTMFPLGFLVSPRSGSRRRGG